MSTPHGSAPSTTDHAGSVKAARAGRIASVLLVVAAILLGIGAASEDAGHAETGAEANEVTDVHAGGAPGGAEHADEVGEAAREAERNEGDEATDEDDEGRLLGVDVESPWAVGSAIVVSLVLAAGLWVTGRRQVAWVVVAIGLVFAILDTIEVSHQLDGSSGLAALAAIIMAGHLGAAAAAGYAATRTVAAPGPGPEHGPVPV